MTYFNEIVVETSNIARALNLKGQSFLTLASSYKDFSQSFLSVTVALSHCSLEVKAVQEVALAIVVRQ